MSDAIETRSDGAVEIVRLNRPGKRNALDRSMYRRLAEALEDSDRDPSVAVRVLMGAEGHFCAGNDIADFLAAAAGTGELPDEVVRFISYLARSEKPLLAAVDGHAIGIGATMLLHCDLVYATPAARLATPFLDLGLVPEAASSLLIPMRIGHARAYEFLVLGEPFTAERAYACGLVNAVVPAEDLEAHTLAVAHKLAAKPAGALAGAHRLLRADPDVVLARIHEEAHLFATCLRSPEARAAFDRFLTSPETGAGDRDDG